MALNDVTRYPLSWPAGWPRFAGPRRLSRFSMSTDVSAGRLRNQPLSIAAAMRRVLPELSRLGVRDGDVIISSNVAVRRDGFPYSSAGVPKDPGVAVYFRWKGRDHVFACDRWATVAGNLGAIAAHIDALRAIERHGVGSLDQAFAGYLALPSKGGTWRSTLGFGPSEPVTEETVKEHFKDRARAMHPDAPGGSHDAMATLVAARDEALAGLS